MIVRVLCRADECNPRGAQGVPEVKPTQSRTLTQTAQTTQTTQNLSKLYPNRCFVSGHPGLTAPGSAATRSATVMAAPVSRISIVALAPAVLSSASRSACVVGHPDTHQPGGQVRAAWRL